MKSTNPEDYQHVARPVAAMPKRFPTGHIIAPHIHARSQLLMAAEGVIQIKANEHIWIVPRGRAVWIPAGIEHSVYMLGAVTIDSLYIARETHTGLDNHCQVVNVSPLFQALVSEAMSIPIDYDTQGRDGLVMQLILHEMATATFVPLHVPMPKDVRLRTICNALLQQPGRDDTLPQWGKRVGASSRTLANRFRMETGLTFGRWRQQARLVEAVRRLATGQTVSIVAYNLGYKSESAFIAMFRRALGTTPRRYFANSLYPTTVKTRSRQH